MRSSANREIAVSPPAAVQGGVVVLAINGHRVHSEDALEHALDRDLGDHGVPSVLGIRVGFHDARDGVRVRERARFVLHFDGAMVGAVGARQAGDDVVAVEGIISGPVAIGTLAVGTVWLGAASERGGYERAHW